MNRLPSLSNQRKDYTLVIFLFVSVGLHIGAIYTVALFTPREIIIPPDTIQIEIAGEPDQPPPLGTNDAETGPPPSEEPTPPPIPEDTPPPPVVPSDFDIPDEKATPTPAAKAAATPKAKPDQPASTPSFNPKARPGAIKGVDAAHGGVVGGVGQVKSSGGKADFVSQPGMSVPYNLRQRLAGVKAFARATITYSSGSITNVEIVVSSGNSLLDTAIKRHVQRNFRVKAGVTGVATLPVGIKL